MTNNSLTSHDSFTDRLKQGAFIAAFALFVGISFIWVQYRGVEQSPEQFVVSNVGTDVSLSMEKKDYSGTRYEVKVKLNNTSSKSVTGVEFVVQYPTDKLRLTSWDRVSSLTEGDPSTRLFDFQAEPSQENGRIRMTFFGNSAKPGLSTSTTLAYLVFERISNEEITLCFDQNESIVTLEGVETDSLQEAKSFKIAAVTTSTDEQACTTANGEWIEFPNGCADICGTKGEGIMCTLVLTYSCDCGEGKCWNTETKTCVNDSGVPVAVCSEGTLRCKNTGIPQKCVSNQWVDQGACLASQQCRDGVCVGDYPALKTANIGIRFAGVNSRIADTTVRIVIKDPGFIGQTYFDQAVTFTATDSGRLNSGSIIDLSNAPDKIGMVIQGPKHIGMQFGEVNTTSSIDLTAYPLRPGNLPFAQNGGEIVLGAQDDALDITDYNVLMAIMTKETQTETDLAIADLNYDGFVNMLDRGLFLKTFLTQSDPTGN